MTESSAQPTPPNASTAQGIAVSFTSDALRVEAIEQAFDYRGDVTLHTADGQTVEGYIFDRRADAPQPYLRLVPSNGGEQITLLYKDLVKIEFSGRDTAAGKSWESWVKKYNEKRARGESANLHPEPLDEPGEA